MLQANPGARWPWRLRAKAEVLHEGVQSLGRPYSSVMSNRCYVGPRELTSGGFLNQRRRPEDEVRECDGEKKKRQDGGYQTVYAEGVDE